MFEESGGPYAGRAPKGYERSDERIREDICDELTRRPDIDPGRLSVAVAGGEVTLEGAVEDLGSRRLADEIASRCIGVRQVHNKLKVEPGGAKKS
jgi:osmotically-inducible protein OsmY